MDTFIIVIYNVNDKETDLRGGGGRTAMGGT